MITPGHAAVEWLPIQGFAVKVLSSEAFAYFACRACGVLVFRAP